MKYHFHPEALEEYQQSTLYYLNISIDLAAAFVNEVEAGIQRILDNPLAWQVVEEDIRRHFLHRFPFGIYYIIEDDHSINIVAIKHMNREPGYWKNRIV